MMKHYEISNHRLIESRQTPGQVIVATAPDEAEKTFLQEWFRLDDYDLASTLDSDEIPRLEFAGRRILFIWKVPDSAIVSEAVELGVSVTGLSFIENRLAFIRSSGGVAFTEREFRHIEDIRDAMLAFLLRTIRHFVSHLRIIKQVSGELEKKITVSMENKHLLQMFFLSESLVYYMDAIEGNSVVLKKLRTIGSQVNFTDRHLEMLDDIILENEQAARQASIYSSVISGLMDARGTIVNNNMNVLLKNLTLINIVFLPLNLIASIWGMSEWSVITKGLDWRISYFLFFLGMVVFGWATWVFMQKIIDRGAARSGEEAMQPAMIQPRPAARE